jgi:hypothetical protein
MTQENIYMRQDNKVATVADSSKKESSSKESKTLSEKDAKTIRKFLQEVGPYEADALRIAIALADGKVTMTTLPSDELLALNRFMNNGMSRQNDSQQAQAHRIHQASQLCKRTADYCNKLQLLAVYEALMKIAVNSVYVEQARSALDRMAATRTGQSTSAYGSSNGVTK